MPAVHAHPFRHTRATDLAEAGMPLDSLQRQLGHADIRTTMAYNHIRPGRLRRDYDHAAEAIEADRLRERRRDAAGGR